MTTKAYPNILAQIAKQEDSSVIVLSNSNSGKCIGPRLSIKHDAGFISNVVDLPTKTNPITVKKKPFLVRHLKLTKVFQIVVF